MKCAPGRAELVLDRPKPSCAHVDGANASLELGVSLEPSLVNLVEVFRLGKISSRLQGRNYRMSISDTTVGA